MKYPLIGQRPPMPVQTMGRPLQNAQGMAPQPSFMQRLGEMSPALLQAGAGLLSGRTGAEQFALGAQGFGQGAQGIKEKREADLKKNKTFQWLEKNATPEELEAVRAGITTATDLFKAKTSQTAQKPTQFQQREEMANKYGLQGDRLSNYVLTGDLTNTSAPTINTDGESKLRKEYLGTDVIGEYNKVRSSFERVRASAQRGQTDTTGASDMALIFNYMKMLDPGSVVRESEFATAAKSGGYGPRIQNLVQNIAAGKLLTPAMRGEFVATAEALYAEQMQNVNDTNKNYTGIAEAYDYDPSRIVVAPEQYAPIDLSSMSLDDLEAEAARLRKQQGR